jgi:hypothetical protein
LTWLVGSLLKNLAMRPDARRAARSEADGCRNGIDRASSVQSDIYISMQHGMVIATM